MWDGQVISTDWFAGHVRATTSPKSRDKKLSDRRRVCYQCNGLVQSATASRCRRFTTWSRAAAWPRVAQGLQHASAPSRPITRHDYNCACVVAPVQVSPGSTPNAKSIAVYKRSDVECKYLDGCWRCLERSIKVALSLAVIAIYWQPFWIQQSEEIELVKPFLRQALFRKIQDGSYGRK